MDFGLTEEQVMFRDTARKFAETEIRPLIPEMEEKKRTPRELIKKMRDLSFYGIQYPAAYGGVGST
jgi:alkylation response protein AidB-like acyl-CoA dehydrogenase